MQGSQTDKPQIRICKENDTGKRRKSDGRVNLARVIFLIW